MSGCARCAELQTQLTLAKEQIAHYRKLQDEMVEAARFMAANYRTRVSELESQIDQLQQGKQHRDPDR